MLFSTVHFVFLLHASIGKLIYSFDFWFFGILKEADADRFEQCGFPFTVNGNTFATSLMVFHTVGNAFPLTTSHFASTDRFLYLTSTVGSFTSALQAGKQKKVNSEKQNFSL